MKFVVMVMLPEEATKKYEAGFVGDPAIYQAMDAYNQSLLAAGVMVDGYGLMPTSHAARISYKGGKNTVTDGPFIDIREAFGGFWIFECASLQEAVDWARKAPMAEGDSLVVRQIQSEEDFIEAVNSKEGYIA
ncbi:MAG TPA: YciI family protein [Thermomicrobiales bacterium]|nr:YciI family protein [Thermomicrobiales bacterium]